jgi:hypothetical protein
VAYQNINFPTLKLIHGFKITPTLPTTVVSNFAKEYRITRYSTMKRTFTFPSRNIRYSDWLTIQSFLNSVTWQTDSFNLIIPTDGTTVKVRLSSFPEMQVVALDASNNPTVVQIGDITLIEVFNE